MPRFWGVLLWWVVFPRFWRDAVGHPARRGAGVGLVGGCGGRPPCQAMANRIDEGTAEGLSQATKPALLALCGHFGLDATGTKRAMAELLIIFFRAAPPSAAVGSGSGGCVVLLFLLFLVHPSIRRAFFSFSQFFARPVGALGLCLLSLL